MGREVPLPARWHRTGTGMFSRTVRITRKAPHQLQLFGGILAQIAPVNRRSSGSTAPQATATFVTGVVIQGTAYGCRSDATDAVLPGRTLPVSVSLLYRSLSEAGSDRLPFCAIRRGDFFGTTAEVHPAEFIQLRLQMVYFAFTLVPAFPAGRGSAPPVRQGDVSVH